MAGKGKPGPAKGHGGRPRTKNPAVRADGYERVTKGPKGKGTQVYKHRSDAYGGGLPPKGSKGKGVVVHHKDHRRANNKRSNLARVSKAQNNRV